MSATGVLDLACERRDDRSRLTISRAHGLSRSSRLPAHHSGGAQVMLSTLGPGMLGGDEYQTNGRVGTGAVLVATGQMATLVFPGEPARAETHWEVADGARLCAIAQPIVPLPGSRAAVRTTIGVHGTGLAIVAETLVLGVGALLRGRTLAHIDDAIVLRDAIELRSMACGAEAVGAVYAVTRDAALRAKLAAAAWLVLDTSIGVRGGVGGTDGALAVRLTGGTFDVQRATAVLAESLLARASTHSYIA